MLTVLEADFLVSYMRYVLGLGAALLAAALSSRQTSAHARWFVNDKQLPPAPPFQLDRIYTSMLVLALLFVIGAVFLEWASRRTGALHNVLREPLQSASNAAWRILSIAFGLTLVINSMTRVLVAPNLPAGPNLAVEVIMFLQTIIGSIFVIQSRLIVGSVLVVLMPFFCWWLYSFNHAIDYAFELIGIGAALYLVGPSLSSLDRDLHEKLLAWRPTGLVLRFTTQSRSFGCTWRRSPQNGLTLNYWERERLAVAILRSLLGLQFVVLAAHDKLLQPAVSLAFVKMYPFVNFPVMCGVTNFTHPHFVFGAGIAEMVLGALLIGNIATRAVCAILTALFVTTGLVFGIHELVGHLPIVTALLVLIVHGSGRAASELTSDTWKTASLVTVGLATGVLLVGVFAPSSMISG
jgi:hypothetical protein